MSSDGPQCPVCGSLDTYPSLDSYECDECGELFNDTEEEP